MKIGFNSSDCDLKSLVAVITEILSKFLRTKVIKWKFRKFAETHDPWHELKFELNRQFCVEGKLV